MKYLVIIVGLFLVGCDNASYTHHPLCESQQSDTEVIITCGTNITTIPIPTDGTDGQDGIDGDPGAVLTSVDVPAGQCVEVAPGIYAENIENGRLADIYFNDSCSDSSGEYCDNLIPSYGRSGRLDDKDHEGSGTTCWADNILITAHKDLESSTTLSIKVIDFN